MLLKHCGFRFCDAFLNTCPPLESPIQCAYHVTVSLLQCNVICTLSRIQCIWLVTLFLSLE